MNRTAEALPAALEALRRVKAAVRFISFEPLMGDVAAAMPPAPKRGKRRKRDCLPIEWAIIGGLSGERQKPGCLYSSRQYCAVRLAEMLRRHRIPTWTKSNLALPELPHQWPRAHRS